MDFILKVEGQLELTVLQKDHSGSNLEDGLEASKMKRDTGQKWVRLSQEGMFEDLNCGIREEGWTR